MINPHDLRELVIEPVLLDLERVKPGMYSAAAINLLLGTAAHESLCGYHLRQVRGPALGIYQMEPNTAEDVLRYLHADDSERQLRGRVLGYLTPCDLHTNLAANLLFATAMARVKYWMDPQPLPDHTDEAGLALVYKRAWNSASGKATLEQYIAHYGNVRGAAIA